MMHYYFGNIKWDITAHATKMSKEPSNIECQDMNAEAYLIKFPKYLAESLSRKKNNGTVGYLTNENGSNINISFTFDPSNIDREDLTEAQNAAIELASLPHSFICTPITKLDTTVLCRGPCITIIISASNSFCGKIMKKFECRPIQSKKYLELKRKTMVEKETRNVVSDPLRDDSLFTFTPRAYHGLSAKMAKKKKEDTKRVRGEREEVTQAIFKCFEGKRYFTVKDLCDAVNQPMNFIREILPEICDCVYISMKEQWELKEQYRCYGQDPKYEIR